jgi:ferric-dicitrate binding protein FerR (iron transport regulator)
MKAVALAVVLALGALGAGYWFWFVAPEKRTEEARPQAPETLLVAEVKGTVEVAGADGSWRPVTSGARLNEHQRIRTGDDATATLRASDGSTIKLSPATDARVDELRRELKKLHLGAGMLAADVQDDPQRLFEVTVEGSDAVARTRGAAFAATSNGSGTAAVATRRGEVTLSARGREVVIRSGQFARVLPGSPPEAPQPVPPSLFLKVAWPAGNKTNKANVAISGETQPGARIRIGSRWVKVDDKGAYRTELTLPDGAHELHVHAEDVGGHVADEKGPRIVVDTKTDFQIHAPKWK